MKKNTLFVIIFFICNIVNAQWVKLNSGVTENLNSLFCINDSVVYVVGDNGKVLKSTDGGVIWNIETSNTNKNLNSVFFYDSLIGHAVGDSGVILNTINGGNSWSIQTSNTLNNLTSIYFTSKDTGYAVGMYSTFIRTTDGGENWVAGPSLYPCCMYLNSICFTTKNQGRILGYDMSGTTILSTTDAGNNWSLWTDPEADHNNWWCGKAMIEGDYGKVVVAGAAASAYFLSNGTGMWSSFGAPLGGASILLNSVCYNKKKYFAVGTQGTVGFFPNYGNGNQNSGVSSDLNFISFADTLVGYIAGDSGVILKTINSGIITSINKSEIIKPNKFTIYPNPTFDILNIETSDESKGDILTLINTKGQVLLQQQIYDSKTQIDIRCLAKGIYILKLICDKKVEMRKIIKE
ncbi:MAG: YCF48-related protein [Bacteroidota bacterium]